MIWGMMELPWQGHLMLKKPAAAVHAVVGFFYDVSDVNRHPV